MNLRIIQSFQQFFQGKLRAMSLTAIAAAALGPSISSAQDPAPPTPGVTPSADPGQTSPLSEVEAAFQELLSNTKLTGSFTIDGKADLKDESYEIREVSKLGEGDLWQITTRIKYGDHDVTLPIAIEVKFADRTPVITLDDLLIPGLGTFSSRVLFYDGRYAGTWQHGEHGGHLFGTFKKLDETK